MKQIIVIHNAADYRGDHSADVQIGYVFDETATLKEVLEKVKPSGLESIIIPPKGD